MPPPLWTLLHLKSFVESDHKYHQLLQLHHPCIVELSLDQF